MAKILIAASSPVQAEAWRALLVHERNTVDVVGCGATGLERMLFGFFDVCILEWQLPLMNAVEICRQYRSAGGTARILIIIDRNDEMSRINALDSGADECISQSCSLKELSALVRALLRRPTDISGNVFRFKNFVFDSGAKRLTRDGVEIHLQAKEYQLLEFLLRHPNHFFKAGALLNRVWSSVSTASEETVRTHVKTLRRKLDTPGKPSIILTTPGLGYRINMEDTSAHVNTNMSSAEPWFGVASDSKAG